MRGFTEVSVQTYARRAVACFRAIPGCPSRADPQVTSATRTRCESCRSGDACGRRTSSPSGPKPPSTSPLPLAKASNASGPVEAAASAQDLGLARAVSGWGRQREGFRSVHPRSTALRLEHRQQADNVPCRPQGERDRWPAWSTVTPAPRPSGSTTPRSPRPSNDRGSVTTEGRGPCRVSSDGLGADRPPRVPKRT